MLGNQKTNMESTKLCASEVSKCQEKDLLTLFLQQLWLTELSPDNIYNKSYI